MNANILLVEDNPGDIDLVQMALIECKIGNQLHVVMDGEAAIKFIMRQPPYTDVGVPDLIFLDLNLPKKNGIEVLTFLKNSQEYRSIPVAVLTTSNAERDIVESYNLHANCYVCKPLDFDKFLEVIKSMTNFWFSIVKLPPNA